jgi:hypothetical protein
VIQIVPHDNGEVFLSKIAADQDPEFFGLPFTGLTIPKTLGGRPYPQRLPDPIVNIRIYDAQGNIIEDRDNYPLNTVFYDVKSEIRITLSQDFVRKIEPFSVLVMRRTSDRHDYDLDVFCPGTATYEQYLDACTQTMPSGGSDRARKMGWI